MGGKSTSETQQTQQSTTQPWLQAQPALTGMLSQLQGMIPNASLNSNQGNALDTITNNANFYGNAFTPQVSGVTNSLLNGGGAANQAPATQANLDQYKSWLTPYASGSMMGGNNGLQPYLDTIRKDVTDQVNGSYAAAGRDFSPANSQAIARGVAQGEAPVIANQYNQDTQNRINAATGLYGAGNATTGMLSGMNNQYNANRGAGVAMIPGVTATANSGPQATLEAEQQRTGIPMGILQGLAQIGVPIAGLGSQSSGSGTGTTTNQMSGAQQFATIMGSLMPRVGFNKNF